MSTTVKDCPTDFLGSTNKNMIDSKEPDTSKIWFQIVDEQEERVVLDAPSIAPEDEDLLFESFEENLQLEAQQEVQPKPEPEARPAEPVLEDTETGPSKCSARVLELQQKQTIARDLRETVAMGIDILETLSKKADQMALYLDKSEIQLNQLEGVENNAAKLKVAATNLSRLYREQSAANATLKQEIGLLEGQKATSRDTIEKARIELGRLLEEKTANLAEIERLEGTIVKLKDDKKRLNERVSGLETGLAETTKHHEVALKEVEDLKEATRVKDKEIAHQLVRIGELDQSIERNSVDLASLRSQLETANTSNISLKTENEQTRFEFASFKRESDAAMRRKEARNAELEARIEVLNRQVASNEELIEMLESRLGEPVQKQASSGSTEAKSSAPAPKAVPTANGTPANAGENSQIDTSAKVPSNRLN